MMSTAALAVLLAVASTACDDGIDSAPIGAEGLTGEWANEAGTRFAFRADGSVAGTGLRGSLPRSTACPDSWSGAWAFLGIEVPGGGVPPENPDGSLAAGDTIDLTAPGAGAGCSVLLGVGRDEAGFALCLIEDPGRSCTGRELLRAAGRTEAESPR
ncbi:hypothetical protein ACIQ9E_03355 [Streptomyces sp. NPDC094448]|uniref:hypothetical protein n=1 Tax=Streptomyces sp. NPDC094448 TaxID=3366063 RepID=UPI0037F3F885